MAQISQSLTFVINRTDCGQLQDSYPEVINGSIEREFRMSLDLFLSFSLSFKVFAISLITCAKQHNDFQQVVEYTSFTDLVI